MFKNKKEKEVSSRQWILKITHYLYEQSTLFIQEEMKTTIKYADLEAPVIWWSKTENDELLNLCKKVALRLDNEQENLWKAIVVISRNTIAYGHQANLMMQKEVGSFVIFFLKILSKTQDDEMKGIPAEQDDEIFERYLNLIKQMIGFTGVKAQALKHYVTHTPMEIYPYFSYLFSLQGGTYTTSPIGVLTALKPYLLLHPGLGDIYQLKTMRFKKKRHN